MRCSRILTVVVAVLSCRATAARSVSYEERVTAQRAIEEVYWKHRIWPADNPSPKPPLDAVLSEAALRARVDHYLQLSSALAARGQAITADQLQAEVERMTRRSRAPEMLRELFDALGGDPLLIAETLARPALAEGLISGESFEEIEPEAMTPGGAFRLPESTTATACANNAWRAIQGTPVGRYKHTAVWTGSEMLIWGGVVSTSPDIVVGGRYNPATDSWTLISTLNQP